MFNFFFKRKEVTLDCFTCVDFAYNYANISYGHKYYPEWWKQTPSAVGAMLAEGQEETQLTIKHCTGFKEFYKRGIVIPSWFSLNLEVGTIHEKTIGMRISNDNSKVISHPNVQFDRFALEDGFNFKLRSVWAFRTNKKIWFSWNQPSWSIRENIFKYSTLPAVINFYEQSGTNINFFLRHTNEKQTIEINPLTPLVILHPLTEEKITVRNHLVSDKEYDSVLSSNKPLIFNFQEMVRHATLDNAPKLLYKFRKNRIKVIKAAEENKSCPYHYYTEKRNGKSK